MHMADALISPAVGGTMWAVSAGAAAYSVNRIKKSGLDEKKVPLMGIMGAFVFAAQMINFTIPGTGSSGHIGGGILLAALLGPYPAFLTITAVLVIQALFFADGGLLALGCNIFNMGFISCFLAYPLIFKTILKNRFEPKRLTTASVAAVVTGLETGAFCVVLETLASGITQLPFGTFIAMMLPIHFAIGLVEGFVTAAVLIFVYKMKPEILESVMLKTKVSFGSLRKITASMILLTLLTGGLLSIYASSYPDGLEWSMEKTAGTTELEANGSAHEKAAAIQDATAFMPDYDFKTTEAETPAGGTSTAGLIGGALTFLLAGATGKIITLVKKREAKV